MRPTCRGFTLIELVIVVVVIGLLAIIALPKLAGSRTRALVATMKSDLRNLNTAEEAYLSDHTGYYPGPVPDPSFNYTPSSGVSVTLSGIVPGGWQALATHSQTTTRCAIFVGLAFPLAPATVEGTPACN
jgi:prepilin-type N-terminal cleavage/methylation domain-containing protein